MWKSILLRGFLLENYSRASSVFPWASFSPLYLPLPTLSFIGSIPCVVSEYLLMLSFSIVNWSSFITEPFRDGFACDMSSFLTLLFLISWNHAPLTRFAVLLCSCLHDIVECLQHCSFTVLLIKPLTQWQGYTHNSCYLGCGLEMVRGSLVSHIWLIKEHFLKILLS